MSNRPNAPVQPADPDARARVAALALAPSAAEQATAGQAEPAPDAQPLPPPFDAAAARAEAAPLGELAMRLVGLVVSQFWRPALGVAVSRNIKGRAAFAGIIGPAIGSRWPVALPFLAASAEALLSIADEYVREDARQRAEDASKAPEQQRQEPAPASVLRGGTP